MRLLLIAYEFPPSPSPQSLRWTHLTRHLVESGVEVHVLTAESWWPTGSLFPPSGVVVHRAWPGGVAGIIALSRRWRALQGGRRSSGSHDSGSDRLSGEKEASPATRGAPPAAPGQSVLNWKGRLVDRLNRIVRRFTFPDERGRWKPHAEIMLGDLLERLQPDVVLSSHEPASSLELGLIARERGFPWVADLGDPVLSFYTPDRWKEKSAKIESETCLRADRVTVTTEGARRLLAERHGAPVNRFEVLTQGYDAEAQVAEIPGIDFDLARLELLYTGSFYQFREPRALVDAVLATAGVRLSIATSRAPDWLLPLLDAHPERLRLLGFVPHAQAVTLQRSADVLVNIANDDPVHVPGKVYEYLGAGRPILHLGDNEEDVAARLVQTHRRGLVSGNGAGAIAESLERLVEIKRAGDWSAHFNLDQSGVEQYQWQSIARRLHALLRQVVKESSQP